MPADQELVLIFGALHLMALIFGGLLLAMFFRSEAQPAWRPPEDEDDGGGGGDGPSPDDPPPAGDSRAHARPADPHTFRLKA